MVRPPHLIQIGSIKRPLGDYRGLYLSRAVSIEYMGNAHFEYGALSQSLRQFEKHKSSWRIELVDSIKDKNNHCLRVLHYLGDEDWNKYKEYLHQLRQDKLWMEECHHFQEKVNLNKPHYSDKYDFWWDITNSLIWSFDKVFMNRVKEHISASLEHMNNKTETND